MDDFIGLDHQTCFCYNQKEVEKEYPNQYFYIFHNEWCLKRNAKESYILNLLQGYYKEFFIPVYQRRFSWTEKYCSRLIGDLEYVIEKNCSSHFFGSVVYKSKDIGGTISSCIIDGQQRITTITLLLLAIFNVAESRKEENIKTHWANTKYRYNGEDLYLSYEWFKNQFELLASFLKKKIPN